MAKISDKLSNTTYVTSINQLNPEMPIHEFPGKYNGDIAELQNKINELVKLVNLQNQIIRNLEERYINALNGLRSEIYNTLDQFYEKKNQI